MNFIKNALGYKHQWWRYLLNLVLCVIFANILALVGFIACIICGISMNDMITIMKEMNIPYCVWNYLSTPNDGNRFSLVDDDNRKILSEEMARIIRGEV